MKINKSHFKLSVAGITFLILSFNIVCFIEIFRVFKIVENGNISEAVVIEKLINKSDNSIKFIFRYNNNKNEEIIFERTKIINDSTLFFIGKKLNIKYLDDDEVLFENNEGFLYIYKLITGSITSIIIIYLLFRNYNKIFNYVSKIELSDAA